MSTMNQEQAARCVKVAEEALGEGDVEKARRFLEKSIRLFPTQRAQAMLQQLSSSPSPSPAAAAAAAGASEGIRHRVPPVHTRSAPTPTAPSEPATPTYTTEQLQDIKRMRRVKDYYELLGVPRDAPDDVIKRAYRKLALKYHPDKNTAPGASEVFKSVSAAYSCLMDESKRRTYDQYGREDPQQDFARRPAHPFGDEVDIFEMFFNGGRHGRAGGAGGGGGGAAHFQFFGGQMPRAARPRQERPTWFALVQLLPILLVVVLSLFNSTGEDDVFSLQQTPAHRIRRYTDKNVEYFVSPSFSRLYDRDYRALYQVNQEVNERFRKTYSAKCTHEQKEKSKLERNARRNKKLSAEARARMLHAAHTYATPSCEKLAELNT